MTDERLCVCCPQLCPTDRPRHYDRPRVCEHCRTRLGRDLAGLPDAYAALSLALEPGTTGNGPRVSGTPSRTLGVRIDPLSLLGCWPGGPIHDEWRDQTGPVPPLVVLELWVVDWIEYRRMGEHRPAPTMASLTGWLLNRLDWACEYHDAVDDFAYEIAEVARTVAAVSRTDHSRGEKIGHCPAVLRDMTRCGATLRVDPYVDQIQCGRCGTRWDRRKGEWVELASAQQQADDEGKREDVA